MLESRSAMLNGFSARHTSRKMRIILLSVMNLGNQCTFTNLSRHFSQQIRRRSLESNSFHFPSIFELYYNKTTVIVISGLSSSFINFQFSSLIDDRQLILTLGMMIPLGQIFRIGHAHKPYSLSLTYPHFAPSSSQTNNFPNNPLPYSIHIAL